MFIRSLILLFFLFFVPATGLAEAPLPLAVQALADKSDRVVVFYGDSGQEIFRIHAVFGQNKGPKTREGDAKTPEGDYTLFPARASDQWEWFMPINYPNAGDIARARKEGKSPATLGNHIGMHSVGDGFLRNVRQSFGNNWTLGCIAIRSSDMDKVREIVTAPVPIRIQP